MSNWGPVLFLAHGLRPVLAAIAAGVHDYGLAVILLTLGVRALLFPLVVRQARFAYRNRTFRRAYQALRQQHRQDLDALQAATKQLAIEQKYNPFSLLGTLVLQMPILAAVYAVFYHFGGTITTTLIPWAPQLTTPDPFHLLPLLVALCSAVGSLIPLIAPEAASRPHRFPRRWLALLLVPLLAFFLARAPVAILLYMATSALWGMLERTFLHSEYARRTFQLQPEQEQATSARAGGVFELRDEFGKA